MRRNFYELYLAARVIVETPSGGGAADAASATGGPGTSTPKASGS